MVRMRSAQLWSVSSPVRIRAGFLKCTALLAPDPGLLKSTVPSRRGLPKSTALLPSHPEVYRPSRAKRQTLKKTETFIEHILSRVSALENDIVTHREILRDDATIDNQARTLSCVMEELG